MIIWIIRALVLIAGPLISFLQISHTYHGLIIGFAVSAVVVTAEVIIQSIPLDTIVAAVIGIVFGLIGARLLDYTIYLTDNQRAYEFMKNYSLLLKIVFAYFGLIVAVRKKSELDLLDRDILKIGRHKQPTDLVILDTSAIIDGRISDVVETKFISGVLVVPRFILVELQSLADSSDTFKRSRARRGLDIIAKLQKDESITVKIFDKDYPKLREADAKLVELAKDLDGKIVTTDFNLNKVAMLQGVTVLNVNDLSNALKAVYLPGETMPIYLVKEGKEHNQAIGYLDDGTMVVVEEGRKHVGKRIDVIVTSILQTSSGRMVFTRPSPDNGKGPATSPGQGAIPRTQIETDASTGQPTAFSVK
ncbi:MAG: PIN domain-containing protein [Endomicrobiales bacterium]